MIQSIEEITETFSLLDDWKERYRYIIELGKQLKPYPDHFRNDLYKVPGCISQVWILSKRIDTENDPILTFQGDSDAHIVKGLVYIILSLFSGKRSSEILEMNAEEILKKVGLYEHLTRQRSNGLQSMIMRIRDTANQN
ncbi:MAG: cysteine desulfuration protein SufE [Candidatus Tokpelaia sp. JSC161]|jgi:cysteine desulfuration protein SufE|nr:MAG: cysteine desulfuration protein SufE [Candidatus Tokpelaia sp. JSC161]